MNECCFELFLSLQLCSNPLSTLLFCHRLFYCLFLHFSKFIFSVSVLDRPTVSERCGTGEAAIQGEERKSKADRERTNREADR